MWRSKTKRLFLTLIIILAIDAFRTLFESIYFGIWYTSLAGLLPKYIAVFLMRPEMVIIPKLINVIAAIVVIALLLKRWLPNEEEEKIRMGNTLQKSEEKFKTLFEQAGDYILLIEVTEDNGLVIADANQAACDIHGYTREEFIGKPIWSIDRGLDKEQGRALLDKIMSGESVMFETAHQKKDGTIFPIEVSAKLLDIGDGSSLIISIERDMTERKRTQDALRESEENLRTILNSIGDAVIAADLNGRIIQINPIAEKLTGWKFAESEGMQLTKVFNIIDAQTRKVTENPVEKVLATGKITGFAKHTVLISKDRTEYKIADSGAPIKDARGNITGVVLVFRDVTEEYRMQEELQKMQKLESIGTMAGGIAHDFNNIMMGLFGNLSMAKVKIPKDNPGFKFLEKAENSMSRATHLARQLLTFAKGGEPVKDNIRIDTLVEEVVRFDLSGSNVMPVFKQAEDLWIAEVDKGQVQQALSNLTINANQAMPDGGHLYITLENADISKGAVPNLNQEKFIKVTVRDEGTGITQKHLDRIFDPYFSTKQTGSGLGLATTYSIISKHGGHISVDSELGNGTTFTIYLPASALRQLPETNQPVSEPSTRKRNFTILVMDDEEIICDVVTEILESSGYSVETASDGKQAIKMYQQSMDAGQPFDGVIMDLTIPGGIGGKDAIKDILEIDPAAVVIVSSGYCDDPVMANYAEYGFKGVAAKPYTMDKLTEVLNRTLKK
ncbi:PAS domain S-box protein [Desulfococcaceae bacterium HSG9]|nr:PAS domain S-box protein [Desulfococcaceae bacterium HSG9]